MKDEMATVVVLVVKAPAHETTTRLRIQTCQQDDLTSLETCVVCTAKQKSDSVARRHCVPHQHHSVKSNSDNANDAFPGCLLESR
jgi:hypothetical protein